MTRLDILTSTSRPYWDGSRILFEIVDGDLNIPCAISRDALQDISETRCYKSADLLRCFENARGRIERLALDKLRARPGEIAGRLSLWSDDIDIPPEGDDSVAAAQATAKHHDA